MKRQTSDIDLKKKFYSSLMLFQCILIAAFITACTKQQPYIFFQDVSWSPDGSKLLLSRMEISENSCPSSIYIINADGTGYTSLTEGPADMWTSWSPDGTKIAFLRNTWRAPEGWPATNDLFLFDRDGTGEVKLTGR